MENNDDKNQKYEGCFGIGIWLDGGKGKGNKESGLRLGEFEMNNGEDKTKTTNL